MEKIVIYNLYKYKLILGEEKGVKTVSATKDKLEGGSGMETKITDVYLLDLTSGWTKVNNVQLVYEVADKFRYKVSNKLVSDLNPSEKFLASRVKERKFKDKKYNKKSKRRQPRKAT